MGSDCKDGNDTKVWLSLWRHLRSFLLQGFIEIDETMRHEDCLKDDMSGSTAITALMKDNIVS